MNRQPFIPSSKSDLDACIILATASNEEIEPHLYELVEWLQDSNWPVVPNVIDRLESVGEELSPVLISVLKGDDQNWKYYLLSGLMLRCQPVVREHCMDEVVRIINSPSAEEINEEVDMVAKDVMVLYSNGNNA